MMKKVLLASLLGLGMIAPLNATLSAPAAHAAEAKVGVVDLQRILQSSALMKALDMAGQSVQAEEKKLVEERNKLLKDLQEMQEKVVKGEMKEDAFLAKKSEYEDRIRNMAKTAEDKIGKMKTEINEKKVTLEKNVENAVKSVAAKMGLDLVVNKQVVLFGGQDITSDVIKALPNR